MRKPNVIFIMTDDQGYGDLSCMGAGDFVTPHLDDLAARGVRFTDWYSNAPVCSPSRAALLTGRYPGNAGVRVILGGRRATPGLTPQAPTLATALKPLGYDTALAGKWHLGLHPDSRPRANGFDSFYGFMSGCIDYFSHIFYHGMAGGVPPIHDLWEDDREIYENGAYMTELITRRSVRYIREKTREDKPFFLYVGYNAPHYPMHAPKKYMDRFSHLPWDRQVMAAMIAAVDDGVGEIVDELRRNGRLEDTLIFFMSDNGPSREARNWLDGNPDPYYGGTVGKLRGHKFSLFEGGIREPAILCYPRLVPGGQVLSQPLAAMDIFPTALNLCGGDASLYELDGRDILPVITRNAPSPHEALFWECGEQTACRMGDYKLVLNGQLVEEEEAIDAVYLSDLAKDMAESRNLAAELPEVANRMREAALAWRAGIEQRWETQWGPLMESMGGNIT